MNNNNNKIDSVFAWQQDFCAALANEKINFKIINRSMVLLSNSLSVNLVNVKNAENPASLLQMQSDSKLNNVRVIHLWEDLWFTKPKLVMARLKSLLGSNIKIHGRKTKAVKLIKPSADLFLNENHLQGAVSSRHKFGLLLRDELIAVATFSALRKMNHTENYKSIELIRFAIKAGYSVSGGLSKLISACCKELKPDDVMTYADRDWSGGEAYLKLGFEHVADLEPQYFTLDDHFNRKLCKTNTDTGIRVFNVGSLKYILKF